MAETMVSLKLLVDTKAKKVLFAEAGKDFVDFLFHILSLPIGTVVELLTKKGMAGCLGDLCQSIEALNGDYMQVGVTKDTVLKPKVAVKVPLLSLNNNYTAPSTVKRFYGCSYRTSSPSNCGSYVTDTLGEYCLNCNSQMSAVMNYVGSKSSVETSPASVVTYGGYVKGVVTYMVMDNLEVKPMSTISGITLLTKFNVKDVASLVEKQVQVGLTEGVALLKASFQTKAVLTTVFL